jgi:hypothetical protein
MCAAEATKAAENLGRARELPVDDSVLAIAPFPNAQHLPAPGEYLKRLFRRDASSTALRTGLHEVAAATATNHHVLKSKELASCLASSRITAFPFTVLTHANYAHGVGRGWGVGRGLGVTLGVGEAVGDGVGVGVGLGGIDGVGVTVGVGVTGGAVGVGDGVAHAGIA